MLSSEYGGGHGYAGGASKCTSTSYRGWSFKPTSASVLIVSTLTSCPDWSAVMGR